MTHVYLQTGHDRRARLCGRCHSWFLTEGARSRFCASCRLESECALSLPWLTHREDKHDTEAETVTSGRVAVR